MPRTLKRLARALLIALATGIGVTALFRPLILARETATLERDLAGPTRDARLVRPAPSELLTVPLTPADISRPDPRGPLGFLCTRREARVFETPPVVSLAVATGFLSVRTVLVLPFLLVVDGDGASKVTGPAYSYGVTHCSRSVLLILGPWPIRLGSWNTGVMWHGPGSSASALVPAA